MTDVAPPDSRPHPLSGGVLDVAATQPEVRRFLEVVLAAGLVPALSNGGPYTVFAPADRPLERDVDDLPTLLADGHACAHLVRGHVVPGLFRANDPLAEEDHWLETLAGHRVVVQGDDDDAAVLYVNGATLLTRDLLANNGVVHVIDAVLEDEEALES